MPKTPLRHLPPIARLTLTVTCVLLAALCAYGCVYAIVMWVTEGANTEVFLPSRGGSSGASAWAASLIYGGLAGFCGWALIMLWKGVRSKNTRDQ